MQKAATSPFCFTRACSSVRERSRVRLLSRGSCQNPAGVSPLYSRVPGAIPQGQPVRCGQFAPRAALGEAPAQGVTLSHGRSPKIDATGHARILHHIHGRSGKLFGSFPMLFRRSNSVAYFEVPCLFLVNFDGRHRRNSRRRNSNCMARDQRSGIADSSSYRSRDRATNSPGS